MSSGYMDNVIPKSIEEISDENLIHYFKPELILIGEGQKATDLLNYSVIQKFVRIGFLFLEKKPWGYVLTDKAGKILQEIHE